MSEKAEIIQRDYSVHTQHSTQFNDRQEKFIQYYVLNGLKPTEAAKQAGYSPESARIRAWELLKRVDVQHKIMELTKKKIAADAPQMLQIIEEIASDEAENSSVRLQAALAILDRAGFKHSQVIEIKDNLSPEARKKRLAELEAEKNSILKLVKKERVINGDSVDDSRT